MTRRRQPQAAHSLLAALLAALLVPALYLTACSGPLRTRIEFSAEEIQQRLEKKFPLTEKNALFTLTFTRPQVLLETDADRLGLGVDVAAVVLGSSSYKGYLQLDGRIEYRPEQGEFYLTDTQVKEFDLKGVSSRYRRQIESVVGSALKSFMASQPIYSLQQDDWSHSLAKMALKSVHVENGKVVAEVGL